MDYYAGGFSLSVRIENGPRLGLEARCPPAQDSFAFLQMLEEMWRAIMRESKTRRIKKVSVTLYALAPAGLLPLHSTEKEPPWKRSKPGSR